MSNKYQPERLGPKVKQMRQEKQWTLNDFAQRVGINKSTLSLIENNHRVPTLEQTLRLADVFDVDVNFLIDDEFEATKTRDHLLKIDADKTIIVNLSSQIDITYVDTKAGVNSKHTIKL